MLHSPCTTPEVVRFGSKAVIRVRFGGFFGWTSALRQWRSLMPNAALAMDEVAPVRIAVDFAAVRFRIRQLSIRPNFYIGAIARFHRDYDAEKLLVGFESWRAWRRRFSIIRKWCWAATSTVGGHLNAGKIDNLACINASITLNGLRKTAQNIARNNSYQWSSQNLPLEPVNFAF